MLPSKRWAVVVTAALGITLAGLAPASAANSSPLSAASGSSAETDGWSSVSGTLPGTFSGQQVTLPSAYRAFRLKSSVLRAALAGAPAETSTTAVGALPEISVPGPDGVLHTFRVESSPVMESGLAAKVPSFRSYLGFGVDDTTATGRFDISPLGFHGSVTTATGSWYVDPAYQGDQTRHVAYRAAARPTPRAAKKRVADQIGEVARAARAAASPAPGSVVQQRVYRLALANDPGYATEVGAANVDLAKAASVNRVNQIYNDDLAIKLVLIDGNQQLDFNTQALYTGVNGPCGAQACFTPVAADPANGVAADDLTACRVPKIDQTAAAITKIVGVDNYDIGHILDNGSNGGIARTGQVGQDADKGAGCSGAGEGAKSNSDLLAVEFLAHEIGHQFGASHVYSATSCGTVNPVTDVEIASGSSIMSYAGTCAAADNIQEPSDPYFSQISIKQMQTYITSTIDPADNGGQPAENGGSTILTTTNTSPVVTVPATLAIPVRTPFTLSGTVTDTGQTPVNTWEQNDPGTARSLIDNNKSDGALFRMFSQAAVAPDYGTVYNAPGLNQATAVDSTRSFPDLAQIAAGNTNAASGTCPTPVAGADPTDEQIACFSEFLPTSARTLHFDLTARDRFPSGGGLTTAESVVTVAGTTPFAVTNSAGSVTGGSSYPVTWSVAGTTAVPFNVANVKISYSTDGGLTFPTVLLASTPNNGTASVTVPATATTRARFKVEAIGQPFFDISHADLTVTVVAATAPVFTAGTPPVTGTVGTPYSYTFVASGSPAPGFSVASGTLPAGLTLNPTSGVLSGTPTTAGASTFTVQATNSAGSAVTPSRTITVTAATAVPVFTASTPPATAVVGTAYTYTFVASGVPAPTFSVAGGTLPAGLTLNPTSGVLAGTPTTAAASTFTVRATNSAGNVVTPTRTITVSAATAVPVFVASTPPATGIVGTAYSYTFVASGSPAPGFSVASGTLPAGLTLNPTSGVLSGTPTTAGASTFTVQATNSAGSAVTPNRTVTISGVTPSVGPVLDTKASALAVNSATVNLSTTVANELLVAYVSADGPTAPTQTATVSGGGLTWTLRKRVNAEWGTSEIWTARASGLLTNAAFTAKLARTGNFGATLTVASYKGANGTSFATAGGFKAAGMTSVNLTTTAANSLVVGVGNDWTSSQLRTVGTGQTLLYQATDSVGDTYWVQTRTAVTPNAGTVVTINDTAPTNDMWNLAVIAIA